MGYRGSWPRHMETVQERSSVSLTSTRSPPRQRSSMLRHPDDRIDLLDNPAVSTEKRRETVVLGAFIKAEIHVPNDFVGTVMKICQERRRPKGDALSLARSGDAELRSADVGGGVRLLRCAQVQHQGYASRTTSSPISARQNFVRLDLLVNGETVERAQHHHAPR